ncbi:YihY/virulence factor BrkB family protein [Labrys monachus]|uniref:Membrane protein n=1 Tax=Labrys monachus TaxID=217067 RepID=A0ABU0FGU8_9HYPH|nr:YihY/virulence factor BrkB family protein [Labrys monachus]MDQ0393836.1 membrane protein [Labrys monachus]
MQTTLSSADAGQRPASRREDVSPSWIAGAMIVLAAWWLLRSPHAAARSAASAGPGQFPDLPADPLRDEGRGRLAASPSEIPVRGWKDIVLRAYGNIAAHRIPAIAAGVTFYAILAIFPAIAALVSVYGLFTDPGTIAVQTDQLSGLLPGGAIEVMRDQMTRVSSHGGGTLGLTFAIGLVTALWSANAGMKALFDALNVVYDEEEKRGFAKLNAISLAFTVAAILFVLAAIGALVLLPVALTFIGLHAVTEMLLRVGRWPALFLVVATAIAVLYRYGPSRDEPRWRWITWGSAFATFGWLAASMLFSWYAANFGSYDQTYGSLGSIIGFMIWIWLSAIVILIGAELNAETEHQTARDTTVGRPEPMGTRGAAMADTVGSPQGSWSVSQKS